MDPYKFKQKTDNEISVWQIAGRTAPFAGLALIILCAFFAKTYLTHVAVIVIMMWVIVSVAWWWWAIAKIARIAQMFFDTTVKFEEVKKELKALKEDVGIRKR